MTRIKKLVDKIDDELCGAKEYAETYLEQRAKGDTALANKFKKMASDELDHAMIIHDMTVQEIELLRKVYTPPVEMQEAWEKSHIKYVEKAAWIKQMLTL